MNLCWLMVIVLGEWSLAVASSSPQQNPTPHASILTTASGLHYYSLTGPKEVVLGPADGEAGVRQDVMSVRGSSPCDVRSLIIQANVTMDKSLVKNCPLRSITFKGFLACSLIKTWKRKLKDNVPVNAENVNCTDIILYTTENFQTEYAMFPKVLELPQYADLNCPEMCKCKWFLEDRYINWLTVDCDDSGLTDSNLPALPDHISRLSLNNNTIKSMEKVIERIKNLQTLHTVHMKNNQVTSVSPIPPDSLRKLENINLQGNIITQLDPMVMKSIFKRRGLELQLDNASLHCNCSLYHINRLYLTYCLDRRRNPCIEKYMHFRCITGSNNKTKPIYEMNHLEGCEQIPIVINYWLLLAVTLGILNIFALWFIFDILLILFDYKGSKNTKRPKLDYIVGWFRPSFKTRCWKEKNEGEEEKDLDSVMNYLRDTSAIRPTEHQRSTRRVSQYPGFYD